MTIISYAIGVVVHFPVNTSEFYHLHGGFDALAD